MVMPSIARTPAKNVLSPHKPFADLKTSDHQKGTSPKGLGNVSRMPAYVHVAL